MSSYVKSLKSYKVFFNPISFLLNLTHVYHLLLYIFDCIFNFCTLENTFFLKYSKDKVFWDFLPIFSNLNSFDPLIYEQKYVCVQYSTYEAQDLEYISFTKNLWITIINILTPWGFSETKIKTSQSSSTVRHWHCRV